MASHEKHQYYYEKYLRDEMHDSERQSFEEKLSADESFRRSFNHYKSNRREFLAELLEEDEAEARKSLGNNSWLYLLISITGIALAVYYFSTRNETTLPSETVKTANSWNIFKRIPFLSKKNDTTRTQNSSKANKPTPEKFMGEAPTDSFVYTEPAIGYDKTILTDGEDYGIVNDRMEFDSFMIAYEKTFFELRLKTIKNETDSMIVDSMIQQLAIKSVSRNAQLSKPLTVYVEFWNSPLNFRGYKFNGKKLVVYGINTPYEIYLLHDSDEFTLRTNTSELELISDNNFHKF
jgi:hypothetical protein